VRRPGIVWKKDNSGFYYDRHPAPGTVPQGDESYYDYIYFHRLGDHYSKDKLVYSRDDIKELSYGVQLSTDDRYLILSDWMGHQNELRFIDIKKGGEPVEIVTGFEYTYYGMAIGHTYYMITNENAPNYKIMAVDLRNPAREHWKEIIPEQKDLLESFDIINNMIISRYLHNAHSQLKVFSLHGVPIHEIELPTLGTVAGMSGRWDDDEMFDFIENIIKKQKDRKKLSREKKE
jgi:prolyl oligopeptidase